MKQFINFIATKFIKEHFFPITTVLLLLLLSRAFQYGTELYAIFPLALILIIAIEIQNGILKEKLSTPIIIFLLFVVWAFASSLWSLHQMESLKRSSFLILISAGTFCLANQIVRYKISIKKIFLILGSVLVGISLFSLITNIPANSWTGGNKDGFMGFVAHQNTLGGILLFLMPFLNYALFKKIFYDKEKLKLKNWKFILLISLNVFAIIFLVLTVSRGAIISYAIFLGLMFVIVFGYKKLLLVGAASIVVLIIALQINFTNKYLNHLLFKGDAKIYSTRAVMYESSLDAAIKGGVFGLGFNVSDPEQFRKWLIRESNGFVLREKGSSLLALIEEVGVIGMLLFYLPQFLILLSLIKRFRRVSFNKSIKLISEEKLKYGFAIAVLISLIIHSQVEAWGTGVGSVFFPLFLILFFLFERLSREEKNTNAIFQ